MMLSEHEMTASQLAETTQRDKADVYRAIAAFQKKGIVEPYGTNRYRVPIRLTDKGRILVKQIQKKANDALKSAGQGLSEEMRQNMYTSLDTIADNLKEMYRKE
jgi:DNA-binding MarR family transcriptional regulator